MFKFIKRCRKFEHGERYLRSIRLPEQLFLCQQHFETVWRVRAQNFRGGLRLMGFFGENYALAEREREVGGDSQIAIKVQNSWDRFPR
jgi:hypothetical protein